MAKLYSETFAAALGIVESVALGGVENNWGKLEKYKGKASPSDVVQKYLDIKTDLENFGGAENCGGAKRLANSHNVTESFARKVIEDFEILIDLYSESI